MRIAFLTFEQILGKKNIGSSRIRCRWVYNNWDEEGDVAEEYVIGQKYDAIIFQKAYWPEYAVGFDGVKILDLCDADWLHWGGKVVEMIGACDAVTCSSPELTEYIKTLTTKPVVYVADREDLSLLPPAKVHEGPIKKAVWFGYDHNSHILDEALIALEKRGIELIVISNKPYVKPSLSNVKITNYPWSEATVDADLQRADIVLNPRSKTGGWAYKSENKTIHAWALGLPVAKDESMLDTLNDPKIRQNVADELRKYAFEHYDVKQSVQQYKDLIKQIKDGKN